MARKLVCDACRVETPETDEEKKEWTKISLGKLNSSVYFQVEEICPACTEVVRHFLQKGSL